MTREEEHLQLLLSRRPGLPSPRAEYGRIAIRLGEEYATVEIPAKPRNTYAKSPLTPVLLPILGFGYDRLEYDCDRNPSANYGTPDHLDDWRLAATQWGFYEV